MDMLTSERETRASAAAWKPNRCRGQDEAGPSSADTEREREANAPTPTAPGLRR